VGHIPGHAQGHPCPAKAKEAFVGFGDPFFNKMQMAQAMDEKKLHRYQSTLRPIHR
jgi:hypothetical protein